MVRSANLNKKAPVEKKRGKPFFLFLPLDHISLELLDPQKWFTYQNLRNFMRKTKKSDPS